MVFVYGFFLFVGVFVFLLGLGFAARWIGYMASGTRVPYATMLWLLALSSVGFVPGLLMILYYWDLVYHLVN